MRFQPQCCCGPPPVLGGGATITLAPGDSVGVVGCAERYYRVQDVDPPPPWADGAVRESVWDLAGWDVTISGGVCATLTPPEFYDWTCVLNGTWRVSPPLTGSASDVVDAPFFGPTARANRTVQVYAYVPQGGFFCGGFHRPEITSVVARAHVAGLTPWQVVFPAASMCDETPTTSVVVDLGGGHSTTLTCTLVPVMGA